MGDAGPSQPSAAAYQPFSLGSEHETTTREVTVLVTGFGPFKNFTTNPSFLIASALPHILPPQKPSPGSPTDAASQQPYTIRLLLHPSPIRVSYATVASLLPTLLQQHTPDYIFHIGVAGGRANYTLETIGHRDNYKIKDVDERDGWKEGEFAWKRDGVPSHLRVGWDEEDVADRWAREVWDVEEGLGMVDHDSSARTGLSSERFGEWATRGAGGGTVGERKRTKSRCQLSVDAGRFLCEFTLFESLARRWLEVQHPEVGSGGSRYDERERVLARERLGKVAFLHVPGGFDEEAIERGARVTVAAIRSLVGSWEEGRRRKDGQEEILKGSGKMEAGGQWHGVVWRGYTPLHSRLNR